MLTAHTSSGVIYGSTAAIDESSTGRLVDAVNKVACTVSRSPAPGVLWSMSYVQHGTPAFANTSKLFAEDDSGQVMTFPPASLELAFDDGLLDSVRGVWGKIMGSDGDDGDFMQFQENGGPEDEEDY